MLKVHGFQKSSFLSLVSEKHSLWCNYKCNLTVKEDNDDQVKAGASDNGKAEKPAKVARPQGRSELLTSSLLLWQELRIGPNNDDTNLVL